MMTAKDFVALADALAMSRDLDDATHRIAMVCRERNPRFNTVKFLAHVRDGREQVGE